MTVPPHVSPNIEFAPLCPTADSLALQFIEQKAAPKKLILLPYSGTAYPSESRAVAKILISNNIETEWAIEPSARTFVELRSAEWFIAPILVLADNLATTQSLVNVILGLISNYISSLFSHAPELPASPTSDPSTTDPEPPICVVELIVRKGPKEYRKARIRLTPGTVKHAPDITRAFIHTPEILQNEQATQEQEETSAQTTEEEA